MSSGDDSPAASFALAEMLAEMGRDAEAIDAYRDFVRRFSDVDVSDEAVLVAQALVNLAVVLRRQGLRDEALAVCLEVRDRFGDESGSEVRRLVAFSLFVGGEIEAELGRDADSLHAELVNRCAGDDDWILRTHALRALVSQAERHAGCGRWELAQGEFDEVLKRFADDPAEWIRRETALACYRRGQALADGGRPQASAEAFGAFVVEYGASSDQWLRSRTCEALIQEGLQFAEAGRLSDAQGPLLEVIQRYSADPQLDFQVARAWFCRGHLACRAGELKTAVDHFHKCQTTFTGGGGWRVQEWVLKASVDQGDALERLGRDEEAIAAYGRAAELPSQMINSTSRDWVRRALTAQAAIYQRRGDVDGLARSYELLASRYDGTSIEDASSARFAKARALEDVDPERAVRAYAEVIDRFAGAASIKVQERVALAFNNRGAMLDRLGHVVLAAEAYGEVITRYGDATERLIDDVVSRAFTNRAAALTSLGDAEELGRSYDWLVARHERASRFPEAAQALHSKARALAGLGRTEEALAVYDLLAGRYGDSPSAAVLRWVSGGLLNRAMLLRGLNRTLDAVQGYDALIARFGELRDPQPWIHVARARFNAAWVLSRGGDQEAAAERFLDFIARYREEPAVEVRGLVAWAMSERADSLRRVDRRADELDALRTLVKRFGRTPDADIRERVCGARMQIGGTLKQLDRPAEALDAYRELLATHAGQSESTIHETLVRARWEAALMLYRLGRRHEAISELELAITLHDHESDPRIRELVAGATRELGLLLHEVGRIDDAIAIWDAGAARLAGSADPRLKRELQFLLRAQAVSLRYDGRYGEALACFGRIVELFGEDPAREFRRLAAYAEHNLALTLVDRGDRDDALSVWVELLAKRGDDLSASDRELFAKRIEQSEGGDMVRATLPTHAS